jgi:hypothetical protein
VLDDGRQRPHERRIGRGRVAFEDVAHALAHAPPGVAHHVPRCARRLDEALEGRVRGAERDEQARERGRELRGGQGGRPRGHAVEATPELVELRAEHRRGHRVLRAEELVERADRRIRLRGDLRHRRGLVALAREHRRRRLEQGLHAQEPARATLPRRRRGRPGRGRFPCGRAGRCGHL